jgi:hypothetical protein
MNGNLFRYNVEKVQPDVDCFKPSLRMNRFTRVELHGLTVEGECVELGFNIPYNDPHTTSSYDDDQGIVVPLRIHVEYLDVTGSISPHKLTIDLPCPINHQH